MLGYALFFCCAVPFILAVMFLMFVKYLENLYADEEVHELRPKG